MGDPVERPTRDRRFLRSLFSDEEIQQAMILEQSLEKSLEPDPAADPITRLDQEWVNESRQYAPTNRYGVLAAPNRKAMRRLTLLLAMMSVGSFLLAIVFQKSFACFGGFFLLFGGLPMVVALRHATTYDAAAATYRRRRVAALAAVGRADEADQPLPVIDEPVWIAKGVMDLAAAITRLHDEYGVNQMRAQEYEYSQAALLAAAPPDERSFFEALNQLEREWAHQRGRLATIMSSRGIARRRLPTRESAHGMAVLGAITSVMLGVFTAVAGAPPLMVGGAMLFGGIPLFGGWSEYRRAAHYQRTHAEYCQRRETLLSRRSRQRSTR